ncbi:MAG: CPBP family intramembrane metalloprotease [Anaerolineae bacterium]|nr:CPBP family intramembrane metalloprotease [Anaerolineae bacterium]
MAILLMLRSFIQRHPVAAYFVLAYLVTWGAIVLIVGPQGVGRGTITPPQFMLVWTAMLLGSGGVGLLLTALLEGRDGLTRLLSGMGRWRVSGWWYAPLLITPLTVGVVLAVLSQTSPRFTPGIVAASDKLSLVILFLVVAFGTFVEELGWTGFATRRRRGQASFLALGLLVGVLWSAWHFMGDFTGSRAAYGDLFVPHFLAFWLVPLTAFRILIVWVYTHTESLLLTQLMHASYSPFLFVLGPTGLSAGESLTYEAAFTVVLCLVTLAVVALERRRSMRPFQPRAV